MTLLSPWTLALAAGIFLPILVVLYMLRLRRQPRRVASTMLWRSTYEDLLANVPFQRLRWSVLLLLQALAVLMIAAALARPSAPSATALGARTIVLIDIGASMSIENASSDGTPGPSRLELAIAEVESMIRAKPSGGEMMLIAFGASPRIVCGFDRNPNVLRSTLRTLAPDVADADGGPGGQTDEPSDLGAALQLAESFSRPSESDDDVPALIVVVTDGHVRTPRGERRLEIAAGAMRELRVGGDSTRPVANLGIVEFDARRRDDDPTEVELFARFVWTGAESIEVPVTVELDGVAALRRLVRIPAAGDRTVGGALGEATLIERLDVPNAALLVLRHGHTDAFETDDIVGAVLPPPRSLRMALVSPDARPDAFIRDLIVETEPESLEILSAAEWLAATDGSGPSAGVDAGLADRFDLVIFDRVDAPTWPEIPSLSFGAAPPEVRRIGAEATERGAGRRLLGWNRLHPLLRHADIGDLLFAGVARLDLPEDAEPVAFGPDGPIIATIRRDGIRHAVVAFTLLESTLPVLPGYPVFVQNAIDFLAGEAGASALVPRTGEPVRLRVRPGAERLLVRDDGTERSVPVAEGARSVTVPTAQRIGVRRVASVPPDRLDLPGGLLPANLLAETESDLRPPPPLELIPTAVPIGGEAVLGRADWWPIALLVALGALAVEWLVYTRRAGV